MASAHFPTFRALGVWLATKPPWRSFGGAAITVAAIFVVGHISNAVSAPSCREDTRRFVTAWVGNALPPPPTVWAHVEAIDARSPEIHGAPSYSAAPFELPFVVRVEWGYSRGPRSGAGGLRTYVAFFGLHMCVSSERTWIS